MVTSSAKAYAGSQHTQRGIDHQVHFRDRRKLMVVEEMVGRMAEEERERLMPIHGGWARSLEGRRTGATDSNRQV